MIHRDVDYPIMFGYDLFKNPTAAYLGSFTGGFVEAAKVDCCKKAATIHWKAIDIKGARSATHLPLSLGGYGPGGGRSLLPDNPFGNGAPPNTITIEMEWNEEIKFR